MKKTAQDSEKKKSPRQALFFKARVLGQCLFLLIFILGLGGWTYWFKPYEKAWQISRETSESQRRFEQLGAIYENEPWKEFFTVGPHKIYVMRWKTPAPSPTEPSADQNTTENGGASAALPEESLAFAFERPFAESGHSRIIFMALRANGSVLAVRTYEKKIGGEKFDFSEDEKTFFESLKDLTRNHLFLIEDDGKVVAMKRGVAPSREILDAVRKGIDFYWSHQEAILKGAEDAHAAG